MATYDGSVRIDTRLDPSGVTKGATAVNAALALIEGNALKAGAALVAAFAPAIAITAIVTIIAKLGELGSKAIEIASDLSEVQNVVDVTFGDMADSVNQFSISALKNFGLSELAAKQYSSTLGAMFKSMGFATDQAAEMSTTMAGLAADMASFYNLDTDTAFEKLRSGISGETEPLKQLGINLSQANLEAYAMQKGMTTAYSSMTEMQKATLRYNYILAVTSDAQGDFARTSSSWANQTRLLNEQWSELLGLIGPFFMQILLPALQALNGLLSSIISALRKLGLGTQEVASTASTAADSQNDLADGITAAGTAANKAFASFDELEKLQSGLGGGSSIGFDSSGLDALKTTLSNAANGDLDLPDLKLVVTPDWRDFGNPPTLDPVLVPVEPDLSEYPANAKEWRNLLPPLPSPVLIPDWGIASSLDPETAIAAQKLSDMWDSIEATAKDGVLSLQENFSGVKMAVEDMVQNVSFNLEMLRGNAAESFNSFAVNSITAASAMAQGVSKNVHDTAENVMQNIQTMCKSSYANIYSFISASATAFAGWGNSVMDSVYKTAINMRDSFVSSLQSMWKSFLSWAKSVGEEVSGFFVKNRDEILRGAITVAAIGGVAAALTLSAGTLAPILATGASAAAFVPALATGAVIPPNNPYLAVVGDQKSGTNIESPLSTIEQAVENVLAKNGVNSGNFTVNIQFTGELSAVGAALAPSVTIAQNAANKSAGKTLQNV